MYYSARDSIVEAKRLAERGLDGLIVLLVVDELVDGLRAQAIAYLHGFRTGALPRALSPTRHSSAVYYSELGSPYSHTEALLKELCLSTRVVPLRRTRMNSPEKRGLQQLATQSTKS